MAAIDTYADVCSDGTQITSTRGGGTPGVNFGGTLRALSEDGMFVRALLESTVYVAIVKGHDTDHAHIIDDTGATIDLGITHGNTCVALRRVSTGIVEALWVESLTIYKTRKFSLSPLTATEAAQSHNLPANVVGTSTGLLDYDADGTIHWTDPERSRTVRGVPLRYAVFRTPFWVGQLGDATEDQIVAVNALTGARGTLYDGLGFEPHAALASDGSVHACWRNLTGGATFTTIPPLPGFTGQVVGGIGAGDVISGLGIPELYPPYHSPIRDELTGKMSRPWYDWAIAVTRQIALPVDLSSDQVTGVLDPDHGGANETPSGAGVAPVDAEYLVGAASTPLSAERVVTDTPTVEWDLATAAEAKANVPAESVAVAVDAAGALDGDGTTASPLAVRVDGTTIQINGSNELETVGAGAGGFAHAFLLGGM